MVDSLNMDITEINTLSQEGVETSGATTCGRLETRAGHCGTTGGQPDLSPSVPQAG